MRGGGGGCLTVTHVVVLGHPLKHLTISTTLSLKLYILSYSVLRQMLQGNTFNLWLTTLQHSPFHLVEHCLPGVTNVLADQASRLETHHTEWMLSKQLFNKSIAKFGVSPNIDLFDQVVYMLVCCSWHFIYTHYT